RGKGNGQGVYSKLWSNGFLDSIHQGVQFSSGDNPILYLQDPNGMDRDERRKMLDKVAELNEMELKNFGDPEIATKIKQYEMAYRMQTAVPEILDVSKEPDDIVKLYGSECLVPGSYPANCLLSRKLSENGVRFVQLYHQGWDQHGNLPNEMKGQAKEGDRGPARLLSPPKTKRVVERRPVFC